MSWHRERKREHFGKGDLSREREREREREGGDARLKRNKKGRYFSKSDIKAYYFIFPNLLQ